MPEITYSMTSSLQLGKHAIQEFKLARDTEKQIVRLLMGIHFILHLFKHEWMVTDLAKLHNGVVQALDTSFAIKHIVSKDLYRI